MRDSSIILIGPYLSGKSTLLATATIYTDGKAPEETRDEIVHSVGTAQV